MKLQKGNYLPCFAYQTGDILKIDCRKNSLVLSEIISFFQNSL